MSDLMSVALARRLAGGEVHNIHAGLAMPAARTVVAQAEQITRLQNALQEVEDWGMNVLEALAGVGILHPDDMEPPA